MKTFPHFTWEAIIERCERVCDHIGIHSDEELEGKLESEQIYYQMAQGLINIVPALRAHPQLEKLVPMNTLLCLRWFPAPKYEVEIHSAENKNTYTISAYKYDKWSKSYTLETTTVALAQVADEVYALIQKYRDDA